MRILQTGIRMRCRRQDVFQIQSERLELRIIRPSEAAVVTDYQIRNRVFHKPYHQLHEDIYFSVHEQKDYLRSDLNKFFDDEQYSFWISYKGYPDRVIGRISFSAVIRGALSSCLVGYHLDQNEIGKGIMHEALKAGCLYMFEVQLLHRIQADIMPSNARSIAAVESLGFRRQGMNERYMCINGEWQDHYIYALLNEKDWLKLLS